MKAVWIVILNGQIDGVFSSSERATEHTQKMDDDDFLRAQVVGWNVDGEGIEE